MENAKIQKRLKKIGIYPCQMIPGPTGPAGKGLEILGSYNSLEEQLKIIQQVQMEIVTLLTMIYIYGILLKIHGVI